MPSPDSPIRAKIFKDDGGLGRRRVGGKARFDRPPVAAGALAGPGATGLKQVAACPDP